MIKKVAKRLLKDGSGSVALVFAIAFVGLALAAGSAVDYGRAVSVKATLQAATDAAALAGAAADEGHASEARRFFEQNSKDIETLYNPKLTTTYRDGRVSVFGEASVETSFLNIIGFRYLPVTANSVASRAGVEPVELVIALDATTSMSGLESREKAYGAITSILEQVIEESSTSTQEVESYVTLMPFADRMVIPTAFETWVSGVRPKDWRGCIKPRERSTQQFAYYLDDAPPSDTQFYYHDEKEDKDNGISVICSEPFVGPTNRSDAIRSMVSRIGNDGTGRFDIALAWGWRLLSPKWVDAFGVADYPKTYGSKRKVLVMITDFKTAAYRVALNPHPLKSGGNVPFDDTPVARDHILDLCNRIREKEIELWLVGVNDIPENIKYFTQSAGKRYISADSLDDLVQSLRKATGIGVVRLVK